MLYLTNNLKKKYKHCESVALYDKRHRYSEDEVISALASGNSRSKGQFRR